MEELDQCQQLGVQLLSNQFCPHLRLHPWGKARFDLFLWYVKVLPKHINTMYVWSLLNCHNSIRDQSIWKILMVTNSNISLISSLPVSILSSFWQTPAKRTQCCLLFKILQKQVNNSAKLSCLQQISNYFHHQVSDTVGIESWIKVLSKWYFVQHNWDKRLLFSEPGSTLVETTSNGSCLSNWSQTCS